jgi:hypothetical protein
MVPRLLGEELIASSPLDPLPAVLEPRRRARGRGEAGLLLSQAGSATGQVDRTPGWQAR